MAVLRYLPGATILENNIVQTVASAAGTLAAIIFVLPGLVMIGWWSGFPYLLTADVDEAAADHRQAGDAGQCAGDVALAGPRDVRARQDGDDLGQ